MSLTMPILYMFTVPVYCDKQAFKLKHEDIWSRIWLQNNYRITMYFDTSFLALILWVQCPHRSYNYIVQPKGIGHDIAQDISFLWPKVA